MLLFSYLHICSIFLRFLFFGGYRRSTLLPPLGFCIFHKLRFLRFQEFFFRHILSKKFNWESAAVRKCGPTRLIFAQVLIHSQLIWHWSWSPPCPCSWPSSWHSCVFSCFIPSQGWSNYFTFTVVAVFTLLYSILTATCPMSLFLSPFLT